MKKWTLISLVLVLSTLLAACGGGGGGAPVDMETEEASSFTIKRPKAWKVNSMDMFGMTILVASEKDLKAESFLESEGPGAFFGESPGVFIMAVPPELAGTEFEFSADEIKGLSDEEPNVDVVKQGDITIDGAKGYELVAKGKFETMGSGEELAAHIAAVESDSLTLVFLGFSPKKDMDKNLDIFEYMIESVKFE